MRPAERLQAWRATLSPLVPALADALLPWLERLDLAVGPLSAVDPVADGDPDGYSDLGRRGPYERLLVSEWLLASEAPDEFVRRAASGEHGFLTLARRSPAGSRVTAAFFDAGPSQIGDPRVAHLALLLLLSRRALAAGARFFWGVLQRPSTLREAVAADQVEALLAGRSRVEASAELIDLCLARPELAAARREVWIIGGQTASALAAERGAPGVQIVEPLELVQGRLLARVRRPDRSRLEVELPLPPPAARVQMLREPFERKAAPPQRGRAGLAPGGLYFSPNARRLFVRLSSGGVASYPVPNSPYVGPVGDPMLFDPGGARLLAVGWERNRTIVLLGSRGDLIFRGLGRRGGPSGPSLRLRPPEGEGAAADAPPSYLHALVTPQGATRYFYRDAGGRLLRFEHGLIAPSEEAQGVVATAQINYQLVSVCDGGERTLFRVHAPGQPARELGLALTERPGEVFFGYADPGDRHAELGLCAVQMPASGQWAVFCRHEGTSYMPLVAPDGEAVVGVVHERRVPSLLTMSKDRKRIWSRGPSGSVPLIDAQAPITAVAAATTVPLIAYLTEAQELVVWSRHYARPVLRVTP